MASIGVALRRTFLLLVVTAGIGILISWRRSHTATPTPAAPPEWPPLAPSPPSRPSPPSPPAAGDVPSWVPADEDGSAPDSHPIKVKESSGIYHVPGGRFYDRTRPDRCYPTADAAEADGYRRSKT